MRKILRKLADRFPNRILSPLLYLYFAGIKKWLFIKPDRGDPRLHKLACYAHQTSPERLLIDVTHQVYTQDRSGIPRVVNKTSAALLNLDQQRYSFEFVMVLNGELYTAYRFAERVLDLETGFLGPDQKVTVRDGDQMLILDCTMDKYYSFLPTFTEIQKRGGTVSTVINDIMPMRNPEWLPQDFVKVYQATLPTVVRSSDILFCVSEFTAADLSSWIQENMPDALSRVKITTFDQGAEIGGAALPPEPIRPALQDFLNSADEENAPIFIQVSIIQPRKGQDFGLDVFEQLWASGRNERLIYVGRKGWKAEELYERIISHKEMNQRFLFVENANETELALIFDSALALFSPSRGEGYGLPVVEASLRGIPVLVNNLQVYREIAGDGGIFFDIEEPGSFVRAIDRVEAMSPAERLALTKKVRVGTWNQGAIDLLAAISAAADMRKTPSIDESSSKV